MNNVGDQFQHETKYFPEKMTGGGLDWSSKPELYKTYPDSERIALPAFEPSRSMTLDKVLKQRRSVREFKAQALSLGQLSYLLWASTGIERTEGGYEFRTAPSAGALYPIETYIVANDVRKLESGLYHYAIQNHELEQLKAADLRQPIAMAALGQAMCVTAPLVFVWTAIIERSKWKYRQRAYRYIYLDAGHIAENLALAAVSLELGTCQIGALFDDEVNKILDIDGTEETTIYMSVVGSPA
ncbi:MAG: SagB/ThcOx family dehydrogenase [Phycisphaerales bacterium]|nr:MAG: SagB/ThcOx family dehydrogenase [Phycisphaerales bacterium]